MNYELFLKKYSTAHHVPITVFAGDKIICKGNHTVQDYSLPLYIATSLPPSLPVLWYSYSPEQLFFGGILLPDTGNLLLVGPVLSRTCSRAQASAVISRLGREEKDIPILMHGLDTFQKIGVEQLKSMLSLLAFHFYHDLSREPELISFKWANIFPAPAVEIFELPDEDAVLGDIEQTILACIQYGKTDELSKIMNEMLFDTSSSANDALSDIKIRRSYIIGANMLSSRAAVSAGLPAQLANELTDFYLDQLMATEDSNELNHLFYRFMMDYAGQVKKMNLFFFTTPFASKVHRYVYAHIYEKLSTKTIADGLHINENYLCKKFKAETGQTIVTHIQKCKISEAKYLLSVNRYSASEISSLLCFSSQSYFTSIFHKYTGMTPVQFMKGTPVDYRL